MTIIEALNGCVSRNIVLQLSKDADHDRRYLNARIFGGPLRMLDSYGAHTRDVAEMAGVPQWKARSIMKKAGVLHTAPGQGTMTRWYPEDFDVNAKVSPPAADKQ